MEYICGVTFAPFACAGAFKKSGAKESLAMMKERTGADFVIFVPGGLQETPQSEEICYTSNATMAGNSGSVFCGSRHRKRNEFYGWT